MNLDESDSVYVVDTETLQEIEISVQDLYNIVRSNMLIPNDGNSIQFYDIGGNKTDSSIFEFASKIVCILDTEGKDFFLEEYGGLEYIVHGISIESATSWRCNMMRYYGKNITVLGNGEKTYVHYLDTIFSLLIDVFLAVYLDSSGNLVLRHGRYEYKEQILCFVRNGVVIPNHEVESRCGTIREMRRMLLM